jgi:hypothetical protein
MKFPKVAELNKLLEMFGLVDRGINTVCILYISPSGLPAPKLTGEGKPNTTICDAAVILTVKTCYIHE